MLGIALLALAAAPDAARADPGIQYQEGQVWEYRTRPEDTGSVLRIQKIEEGTGFAKYGPIYHISIIGVQFRDVPLSGTLQHLPVSRETLDASVTRLSNSAATFPSAKPGIEEWRSAKGGVFTIPLAEIIGAVEQGFKQDH